MHIHKSVLYIEDDPDLRDTYERALANAGYRVYSAQHAQEAVDVLDTHDRVDVIIVDLFLPEHNGLAILHQLQSYADWQTIPVFILSSYHPDQFKADQEYLEDLGVIEYLSKQETSPQELINIIQAAVGGNST